MDSGGGIHKAHHFFPAGEDILIHNVDVICNINIQDFFYQHIEKQAIATLAVRNRLTQRYYLFHEDGRLTGWKNEKTGEQILVDQSITQIHPLAFSGISILSSEFIQRMKNEDCYPIRDEFLRLGQDRPVYAYQHNKDYWMDVGKAEQLSAAENFLRNNPETY